MKPSKIAVAISISLLLLAAVVALRSPDANGTPAPAAAAELVVSSARDAGPQTLRVTTPPHRRDIQAGAADLIEELARIHGYDRLPALAEELVNVRTNSTCRREMLAVSSSQFEPGPTLDWVTNRISAALLLHVGNIVVIH